jgi:CarD family transcriptional regulator
MRLRHFIVQPIISPVRTCKEVSMLFKAGDRVVHPTYGVGDIVRLEERKLAEPTARLYYVLAADRSTVWVPVDTSASLRALTPQRDLDKYRTLLKGRPTPLISDHRERRLVIAESLKSGSFQTLCEVVRDLAAFGWHKSLAEADAALFNRARETLCREWAASGDMSFEAASEEVSELLSKARDTYQS